MRAKPCLASLVMLLSKRQYGHCFHVQWTTRQPDSTSCRTRGAISMTKGSPRHHQLNSSPGIEEPTLPTSPRTSRRQLLSKAVQLGVAGSGVILARPSRVSATGTYSGALLRETPGQTLAEDRARQTNASSGGLGLMLPAVGTYTKRIFLARHGQTDLNKLEICQGRRLNPPLNEKGRGEAQTLLTGVTLDAIFSSPLRRARETADIVRESHPAALRSVCDELNEVDFGGAEGLPKPLAAAVLAPAYLSWSNGVLDKQAGRSGETGLVVRRRAEAAAGRLLGACREGGQVLGVSHSSMIKFMLATLLDIPLGTIRKLGQDNCAVNALDFDTVSGIFEAVAINGGPAQGRAERFGGVYAEHGPGESIVTGLANSLPVP